MRANARANVKVTLSPLFRHLSGLTGEPEVFEVMAPDALRCLRVLVDRFPSMRQWTYDKEGKLLPLIWFFVNGQRLQTDEFTQPLKDGDELFIVFGKV